MNSAVQELNELDWDFETATTDQWTHDLHPYPAKFIPQIAHTLIDMLSKPGDTVLDPFCGGGTTLVEATILGRNAIGIDSNPLAVLISRAKTAALDEEDFSQLQKLADLLFAWSSEEDGRRTLFSENTNKLPEPWVPDIPNLENWFSKQVAKELGLVRATIEGIKDSVVRTVALVALSRIIVRVSNQDSETRYAKRLKRVASGDTLKLCGAALQNACQKLRSYQKVRQSVRVSLLKGDARKLASRLDKKVAVDLLVTSPPYPNAFDYHLYHRHRLFWLGYDPREVMKTEIGSHLNYQRTSRNGIYVFADDMRQVFGNLRMVLRRKAYCCFVIGDSIFSGEIFDNSKLLTEISREAGFSCEADITRNLPVAKRSFMMNARRLRHEHILIFKKR